MIRKATLSDIDTILKLTRACAKHMIDNEIFQWNAHYPNQRVFKSDIERDELFVMVQENDIVGCIVISTLMDVEYLPILWLTRNLNNVYIHRLAVHPKFQGKGIAQQMMDFAETTSKQKKMQSVRLDTFSQNQRNQKFYEVRGYKRVGHIYFPKQSEFPFYCYELLL